MRLADAGVLEDGPEPEGSLRRGRLIVRRPHPTDRRAQTIHLTPRAAGLKADAIAAARRVNPVASAAPSPPEQDTMIGLMTRVIASPGHPA